MCGKGRGRCLLGARRVRTGVAKPNWATVGPACCETRGLSATKNPWVKTLGTKVTQSRFLAPRAGTNTHSDAASPFHLCQARVGHHAAVQGAHGGPLRGVAPPALALLGRRLAAQLALRLAGRVAAALHRRIDVHSVALQRTQGGVAWQAAWERQPWGTTHHLPQPCMARTPCRALPALA